MNEVREEALKSVRPPYSLVKPRYLTEEEFWVVLKVLSGQMFGANKQPPSPKS